MKKSIILTSVFVAVVLFSCKPDKMAPAPSITGFTPASGRPGDTVTITGNNFSTQASNDIVALNSKAASVINATGTTLTVEVPIGATTGSFSVTVNGNTGVSADNFTVLPPVVLPPAIASFTPAAGAPGTEVTITGTGFSAIAANNTVKFADNKTGVITGAATTWIKVTVPQGAVTGNISVAVAGTGASVSATAFIVPPPPAITSFTPALGLPGDTVVVTGTGFSSVTSDNTVKFADNAIATVTAATPTQLTVIVPATAVKGTLSTTVSGQSGASTATFEVLMDIPRTGLVAFYPFSGNANDASGSAFDLTLNGTCTADADRFGLPAKAYYFAAGSNYAMSPDITAAQVTQPLTAGAWVKYNTIISSSIVSKYQSAPGGYNLGIVASTSAGVGGGMDAYIDGGISAHYQTSFGILPVNTAGQWVFILMTYDGATMKFYKDASLAGTLAAAGTVTATVNSNMRIGPTGGAFSCSIDDVTIYNRVLTDAEILQLYNATISKK